MVDDCRMVAGCYGHDRISQRLKSRFPGYALEDCRLQRREF